MSTPLCWLLTKVYDCGMDMLTIPYLLVNDEKGEMDVTTTTTNKMGIMRLLKLTINNNSNDSKDKDKEEDPI